MEQSSRMPPLLPNLKTPSKPSLLEILLAAAAHLSGFFAPFLAPLIIWLITRWWLRFVSQHARQALVTHLLILLAIGVFGLSAVIVLVLFLGGTVSVQIGRASC